MSRVIRPVYASRIVNHGFIVEYTLTGTCGPQVNMHSFKQWKKTDNLNARMAPEITAAE